MWSKEFPTELGWHWMREGASLPVILVKIVASINGNRPIVWIARPGKPRFFSPDEFVHVEWLKVEPPSLDKASSPG